MIETTTALIAIGAGAVILMTSTIAALAIVFTPTIVSPVNTYGISEEEYQERLKHNNDSLYMHSRFGGYPRPFVPRSSIRT